MFEVLISPLGFLLAATLIIVYAYYRFAYLPFQTLKRCGIKGPEPLPIIGNLKDIIKTGRVRYFELLYKKYGPVCGYYNGKRAVVLVTDLDIVKQILVNQFDNFTDREPLPDLLRKKGAVRGIFVARGEAWKSVRQILSPSFTAAKIRMMIPLIKRSTDTLLEKCSEMSENGKSYNMFYVFRQFTVEVILAVAFGRVVNVQRGEADKLTEAAHSFFVDPQEGSKAGIKTVFIMFQLLDYFPLLMPVIRYIFSFSYRIRMFAFMNDTLLKIVEDRRSNKQTSTKFKDLLQLMIDTTGEEEELEGEQDATERKVERRPMSSEEIVAHSVNFVLAGYETTANTLSFISSRLAINPKVQEKLQAEIDRYYEENPEASLYNASQDIQYLDMVIMESLRLYPSGAKIDRVCKKETVINGVTFPKNCVVYVPVKLIHHLPQYWSDPDKFDPERFTPEEKEKRPPYSHLPFSHGPRSCIGMRVALLEMKITLIEVLRKFSFVQAPDTEIPLKIAYGITLYPANGVFLRVAARE